MPEPEPVDLGSVSVPLPPFHRDPFNPVLFAEVTPHVSTEEQDRLLTEILLLSSSDSRFAQKALAAIKLVLAGGAINAPPPVVTSLEPATGAVGATNLKVKCKGTGFDPTCVIHINGNAMPTTFVSATEVNTNVNLTTAGTFQVVVRNGAGVLSNSMTFIVTAV